MEAFRQQRQHRSIIGWRAKQLFWSALDAGIESLDSLSYTKSRKVSEQWGNTMEIILLRTKLWQPRQKKLNSKKMTSVHKEQDIKIS